MAYQKTIWESREGEGLDKFTKLNETVNTVVLISSPDSVTRAGTPFSPENMNKIEQGIYDAHSLIAAEAHARQQDDQALQQGFEELLEFVRYLVSIIESEWGSITRVFPLATESGEYLVTEDDDYLVAQRI